ncbi:MAG: hypothetical protein SGARI_006660 [Bacillariaceae sp.]
MKISSFSTLFSVFFAATIVPDAAASKGGKKGGRMDCSEFIGYFEGLDTTDGSKFTASIYPNVDSAGMLEFIVRDDVAGLCDGSLVFATGTAMCKRGSLEASVALTCSDDSSSSFDLDFVMTQSTDKQFLIEVFMGVNAVTSPIMWKMV